MKKIMIGICVMFMALGIVSTVGAVPMTSVTYYFTSDHITGTYGKAAPFGTVQLTLGDYDKTSSDSLTDDVRIVVTLFDGSTFIRTGAGGGTNFVWGANSLSLSQLWSNQSLTFVAGPIHADGTGDWDYGLYFTGQENGGANRLPGPITFYVMNSSIENLLAGNADDWIFAADVYSEVSRLTGMIDASTTTVPEPTTLLLLGLGMVGVAGAARKFRK